MDSTKWCWTILQAPICHCWLWSRDWCFVPFAYFWEQPAHRVTETWQDFSAVLNISTQCLCQWFHGYCCLNFYIASTKCFVPGTLSSPYLMKKKSKVLENINTGWKSSICISRTLPSGRGVELFACPRCTKRKGSITSHFQSFSPCWTFPLAAFPTCFGIAQGDTCVPWSAGSRTTGWQGEDGIRSSSNKA